jgi:hypothetical protein
MFIRKLAERTGLMGLLIAFFAVVSVPQAQAAADIHFDSIVSGCVNAWAPNQLDALKVVASQNVTINTLKVAVGSGSTTNFSTSRFYIYSNSATGAVGSPNASLATFTPDSISGSGSTTVANYTGSFTSVAGTSYWIVSGQKGNVFPYCYWYSNDASVFSMSAFNVDTGTNTSGTTWARNSSTSSSPVGASWSNYAATGLAVQFTLGYFTVQPVIATIATQSGSLKADYRTVTPLTVNVDTNSKVTFYANGKVIAGCRNILSSGGNATCNWKPSVHGSYRIYASANPVSSSYTPSNSSAINVGVAARTNKR